ncbi:MAG: phage head-tail connector protein [Bacillota bacterium]
MAILDDAKSAIRISNTAYNTEISDLIAAARLELIQSGVIAAKANDDTDLLVKRAILVYVKANFGWNNPDSEKLKSSFEILKNHLSVSVDYSYYTVTVNAGTQCEVTFDGETKQTNDSGTVVFYSKPQNHVEYTIDGVTGYVDIAGNTVIEV